MSMTVSFLREKGTRYDEKASEILAKSGLFDEETSKTVITNLFNEIKAFRGSGHNWLEKYLKGIARMIIEESDGDVAKAEEFIRECPETFEEYLMWVRQNREKIGNQLDTEFNDKLSYQQVKDKVEDIKAEREQQSKDELANMKFGKSDYTLVPIESYEQMHNLYGGTKTGNGVSGGWCHTNGEGTYNDWVRNGKYKFYVLQKDGWEDIPFNSESNYEFKGKDEYGNSLIALRVNRYGDLKNATLRCNHVGVSSSNIADKQYDTYAELSKIAGFNVEEAIRSQSEVRDDKETLELELMYNGTVLAGLKDEDDKDILEKLIVPEGVKHIAENSFSDCTELKEVIIPEGVIALRAFCFSGCKSLKKINIPNTVNEIEIEAFSGCESLEEINLPDSVDLNSYVFRYCRSLKRIKIPSATMVLGRDLFFGCTSLEEVEIPNSVTEIGIGTFMYCESLKKINIPETVKKIGSDTFCGCGLETITIPSSIERIRETTFNGCSNLKSVYLTNNIKRIETKAFAYCYSLDTVEGLDAKNVEFGENVFYGTKLADNEGFIIFDNILVGYVGLEGESPIIPEGVTDIVSRVFYSWSITNVTFPSSLERIGNSAFYESDLTSVTIPSNVQLKECCFASCLKLKTVVIEDGITELPQYAFAHCYQLESVTLPSTIKNIDYRAFAYCRTLKEINLPNGLEKISAFAFEQSGLEKIMIPASVTDLEDRCFTYCVNLKDVVFENPDLINELSKKRRISYMRMLEMLFEESKYYEDLLDKSENQETESYSRTEENTMSKYKIDEEGRIQNDKEVIFDQEEKDDEEPEGHFADDKDDLDFEDEVDEDDILVEETPSDEPETVVEVEPINDTLNYKAKDLALATVELLDSDDIDSETGIYNKREDALDELAELSCMAVMSDDEWDEVCSGDNWSLLQKFIEDHPNDAEEIFNSVANIFGYNNYKDYQSYLEWTKADEEDYIDELLTDDDINEPISNAEGYEDDVEYFDEATNVGAIANVPAEHKKIDLFDEEDEEEYED